MELSNNNTNSNQPIEFNKGTYGFDPYNQYIGLNTPIDNIKSTNYPSANAMDTNWGGASYAQKLVDEGKFAQYSRNENEI